MFSFQEDIKFTTQGKIATLYNLKNNHFIKIQSKGLDFLKKFIEGNGKEILGTLDENEYEKFMTFLSYLKKREYITEGTPEVNRKKNPKQEFLETERMAYYEVTHKCNLKCKFCYANPNFFPAKFEGDFKLSKKIIDKARQLNIVNLVISGGEPLLRKDIFKIIKYAKKRMRRVIMVTNGVLIDEKVAIKLKDSNLDAISISTESSQREVHDNLRGEGTFEKILTAIDWLKHAGFNKNSLNITAIITQKNIHSLHEFPQFAEDLDVNMNFSSFQPVGRGKICNELAVTKEQFFKFIIKLNERRQKDWIKYIEENDLDLPDYKSDSNKIALFLKNRCGIVKRSLGIKSNGDLVPCHLFFSVKGPDMIIGNILEKSIADKLWDFYIKKIPTVDEKEGCKECNVRYFCGGSCFAPGYFKDGTFNTPHPFCERVKILYSAADNCLGSKDEIKCLGENIYKYLEK